MSPKAKPEAIAASSEDEKEDSEEDDSAVASKGEFLRLVTPSPALAAVVGAAPLSRMEVVKRLWEYIHKHDLQDAKERRMINADALLEPIFGAKQFSMFEMTLKVNQHLR